LRWLLRAVTSMSRRSGSAPRLAGDGHRVAQWLRGLGTRQPLRQSRLRLTQTCPGFLPQHAGPPAGRPRVCPAARLVGRVPEACELRRVQSPAGRLDHVVCAPRHEALSGPDPARVHDAPHGGIRGVGGPLALLVPPLFGQVRCGAGREDGELVGIAGSPREDSVICASMTLSTSAGRPCASNTSACAYG
jgi:hypothetical protein